MNGVQPAHQAADRIARGAGQPVDDVQPRLQSALVIAAQLMADVCEVTDEVVAEEARRPGDGDVHDGSPGALVGPMKRLVRALLGAG